MVSIQNFLIRSLQINTKLFNPVISSQSQVTTDPKVTKVIRDRNKNIIISPLVNWVYNRFTE